MDSLIGHCHLESNEYYDQAVLQGRSPFSFHRFVTKHCPVLKNITQMAAFRNQAVISHFPINLQLILPKDPKSSSNKPNE